MKYSREKIWFAVTVASAVLLTGYTLWTLVTDPAHSLMSLGGDGAKNEYAYLYQCIYEKGFWFEGMNYPYGDNIVFADGQAALSVTLNMLTKVTVEQALAILWLLISSSYVLSVVYLYKVLRVFKVHFPLATIFACIITFFSPQVFRIFGHFGLSYVCVVPMLFYWTIQYHRQPHWKYCLYMFILGIIIAFLHPYFSGMLLVWVMCYIAGSWLFTQESMQQKIKHSLPIFASAISVFAVMWVVMYFTDPVKDRPVAPYGMLAYCTRLKDIVTSMKSPLWLPLQRYNVIRRHMTEEGEGYVYIGVITIIVVLFSLVKGIAYKRRKDEQRIIVAHEKFSPVWLFMAFAALLFSMGVPYIWRMEWLLDYMSFMRQFRSLGRFSWIFYHIISVYAVVVIDSIYSGLMASGKLAKAYAILIVTIGVWGFEASGNVKSLRQASDGARYNYEMFFSKQQQSWEGFLQEHNYTKNDFQAILTLNFFHVGSDKIWADDPGWKMTLSAKASFQLHKPIVDVLMSRTSWSQTEKSVKIAAGPFVTKPLLSEIKSNKPFLLMKYENDTINVDELYLLSAADHIGHYSQCEVYAFYPDRQLANDKRNADSINNLLSFVGEQDTCIEYKGAWYVDHMDRGRSPHRFFGKGAVDMAPEKEHMVCEIPVTPLADKQNYEFSCWFLLSDKTCASPWFRLESLDSEGNTIQADVVHTKNSVDNDSLWFRCSTYLRLSAHCARLRCTLENEPMPSYITMDELMLRPADALILSKSANGSVMVNNHLFIKK